jgi:tripartite-type tricarboxylate transporter receptor subunit TctC
MGRKKNSKWIGILVIVVFVMVMGWGVNKSWTAEIKYPTKPIQIVIGYAPGATDMVIRPLTEKLPEYLGQTLPFVYKPGAGGAVGASFVAKSKPDGYTIFVSSSGAVILNPLSKEGLDYTLDDFIPICRLGSFPLVLAVKTDSPWKTLKDVVEAAKKSPGKLNFSSSGVFSTPHLLTEMFIKSAGINLTHVPCVGTGPAVTALLGGHVNMAASPLYGVEPHSKSGALRIIAIGTKERSKQVPNVPTFSESGYPVIFSAWHGFFAPKGTPKEVIGVFSSACKKVVENHKSFVEDQLEKISVNLDFLNPEEFAKEVKAENEAMKKIVPDLAKSSK